MGWKFEFELKHCDSNAGMDKACLATMKQIFDKRYDDYLRNDILSFTLYLFIKKDVR